MPQPARRLTCCLPDLDRLEERALPSHGGGLPLEPGVLMPPPEHRSFDGPLGPMGGEFVRGRDPGPPGFGPGPRAPMFGGGPGLPGGPGGMRGSDWGAGGFIPLVMIPGRGGKPDSPPLTEQVEPDAGGKISALGRTSETGHDPMGPGAIEAGPSFDTGDPAGSAAHPEPGGPGAAPMTGGNRASATMPLPFVYPFAGMPADRFHGPGPNASSLQPGARQTAVTPGITTEMPGATDRISVAVPVASSAIGQSGNTRLEPAPTLPGVPGLVPVAEVPSPLDPQAQVVPTPGAPPAGIATSETAPETLEDPGALPTVGADLITGLLPFDRSALEQSLARFLEGLDEEPEPLLESNVPNVRPVVLVTTAIAVEAARRWRARRLAGVSHAAFPRRRCEADGLS